MHLPLNKMEIPHCLKCQTTYFLIRATGILYCHGLPIYVHSLYLNKGTKNAAVILEFQKTVSGTFSSMYDTKYINPKLKPCKY